MRERETETETERERDRETDRQTDRQRKMSPPLISVKAMHAETEIVPFFRPKEETVLFIERQNSINPARAERDRLVATSNLTEDANKTYDGESLRQDRPVGAVRLIVGEERRLLIGQKSKMAAASPIFDAMFRSRWRDGEDEEIEIPDVQPNALLYLLR